jgi:ABC-type multidrug transport system fused ATPase/permease subunit
MSEIKAILRFGFPYLKRYWVRLVIGIVLGIFFGFFNGLFVWSTKTLFERLTPEAETKSIAKGLTMHMARDVQIIPIPRSYPLIVYSTKAGPAQPEPEKPKKKKRALPPGIRTVASGFNNAVDRMLPLRGRKADLLQILGGLFFLPILGALRGYIGYLSSYCMNWVSERVIKDMRLDVLLKLNSLSLDFFNRTTMGELMARVNGDTTALYRCLSLGFSDLIKEPITIISCVLFLVWIDPKLTLLAVIFTPLTVIPIRLLGQKAKKAVRSALSMGMSQDSLLVEVYSSIRIVKAFNLEDWQVGRFRKIYQKLVHIGMKNMQAKELINPTIEVISMFGLGIVVVFVFYSQTNISELVAFLTGVTLLYTPIKKLGGLHVYFQQATVGAQRLIEIFQMQPSVKEKPDALPVKSFDTALSFENVNFSYGDNPVLQDINLIIPKGMSLGIAGPSGHGKTTLISLILRFYDPVTGSIKIDGTDFRDVSVKDLRDQMAFVGQEVVIFDQTIAENIACGKLDATPAQIEAAARAANAHDFIMQTPQGYQTRTGERGVTLSAGQRQRISIARAFVRNAPILVLDEATASLDSQSEAEVQGAIDRLSENRTVICIAHRLSTLRNCDEIIVVHEGRIKERGSFQHLIRHGWIFKWMAEQQGLVAPALVS